MTRSVISESSLNKIKSLFVEKTTSRISTVRSILGCGNEDELLGKLGACLRIYPYKI